MNIVLAGAKLSSKVSCEADCLIFHAGCARRELSIDEMTAAVMADLAVRDYHQPANPLYGLSFYQYHEAVNEAVKYIRARVVIERKWYFKYVW